MTPRRTNPTDIEPSRGRRALIRSAVLVTAFAAVISSGSVAGSAGALAGPPPTLREPAPALHVPAADPRVVVPTGRYAIGDSVMLGSKKLLTTRGISVNAIVSRQFSQAVPTLAALRRANRLPRNVVVHLGTNGIVKVSDCRAIVDGAGSARRVFLVTAHGARSWIPTANAHLRTCAKAYPGRRVILVDWDKAAAGHRGWFGSDGIHPSSIGRPHYVGLITSALAHYGL